MYIEIRGVEFANKGAELMLRAVMEQVGARVPSAKIVLGPGDRRPYVERARLGTYQKLTFASMGAPASARVAQMLPKKFRRYYGLVTAGEVRVILDASGFAYSDQWGPRSTATSAAMYEHARKLGTKVILLPQALGPFKGAKVRAAVRRMVDNADLVFPRDDASYRYVVEAAGERGYVVQAPDFTNLIDGIPPASAEFDSRACVIPNARMIEKVSADGKRQYLPFLRTVFETLLEGGARPYILLHADQDAKIGAEIAAMFAPAIPVVHEPDPLKIKGLLGRAGAVIGSRFHGMVSALSQGVPALAAGWSHKYEMLFQDYGFPEGVLHVSADAADVREKVADILRPERAASLRAHLLSQAAAEKERSRAMWERVFQCLGQ
jgi:polysaccharide pyruvyl transferase WcaK-like protein